MKYLFYIVIMTSAHVIKTQQNAGYLSAMHSNVHAFARMQYILGHNQNQPRVSAEYYDPEVQLLIEKIEAIKHKKKKLLKKACMSLLKIGVGVSLVVAGHTIVKHIVKLAPSIADVSQACLSIQWHKSPVNEHVFSIYLTPTDQILLKICIASHVVANLMPGLRYILWYRQQHRLQHYYTSILMQKCQSLNSASYVSQEPIVLRLKQDKCARTTSTGCTIV